MTKDEKNYTEKEFKEEIYNYIVNRLKKVNIAADLENLSKTGSTDDFFRDVDVAGIFNTNMWLTNNFNYLNNVDDLEKRVSSFEKILTDKRMAEVRKKMGLAAYVALAKDYGAEYVKILSLVMKQNGYDNWNQDVNDVSFDKIREDSFLEGKSILQELFDDPEIQKLSDECHIKLLSGRVRDDWSEVEYFRSIAANDNSLNDLHGLLRNLHRVNTMKFKFKER